MSDEDGRSYVELKDHYREQYQHWSAVELAKRMKEVQKMKEVNEERLKAINAEYDIIRTESLPNAMDTEGLERMTIDGVGRVSLTADMYISVQDKVGLYLWLDDNGFKDLITETVNASTLKAFLSKRMKEGKEVPSQYLNINPYTRASITKS